jgi:hypothetical protein
MMKTALGSMSLLGLFAVAPANAQDAAATAPAPDWSLAGSLAVQSDYRFAAFPSQTAIPCRKAR